MSVASPDGASLPVWPGFEVTDEDHKIALIGTPQGSAVAWLLINHVDELLPKHIEQIFVFSSARGKLCIAWFLAPNGPPTAAHAVL